MKEIDFLEKELVNLAGPLAVFVIKKQIKDMGLRRDKFPKEKLGELIERSVKNAIFEPSKQKEVIRNLRRKLVSHAGYT